MKLSDYNYQLPKDLIAQFPLEERDTSRLMIVDRKSAKIFHRHFGDILEYLNGDDSLILNDTKVFPARIFGKRTTGAKVEILLLENGDSNTFKCLLKPARVKVGEKILLNGGNTVARLVHKDRNLNLIQFEANEDIKGLVNRIGVMPLPPYIRRESKDSDRNTYQTVYAKIEGAVAAPTAGLHFSKNLLTGIQERGVNIGFLTLHVGWGTFRPIKSEDVTSHKMEEEEFELPSETAELVIKTKQKKGRIFAVGTTTTRALETAANYADQDKLRSMKGKTNLFIYPGFKFKIIDCLLTNFHLPKSSLFLLVCAFVGRDLIFKAYQEAIEKKYRFYSYGDAMLIL